MALIAHRLACRWYVTQAEPRVAHRLAAAARFVLGEGEVAPQLLLYIGVAAAPSQRSGETDETLT
jgi:hypothetical protein